ncbi:hypothetical protein BC827DRAFT_1135032 [Russula dissimulans]|nr:hypothetical protein BC827DRAFT_1135032 [Russula dissimulans]
MWFNHKQDDGVTFTSNFGNDGAGILIETIPLVCTVIENCINEYQVGTFKEITFSGSAYKSRYLAHVGYFEDLTLKTKQNSVIPRLRQHLLRLACRNLFRKHAKAKTNSTYVVVIEDTKVEAAKKDWENIMLSDEAKD